MEKMACPFAGWEIRRDICAGECELRELAEVGGTGRAVLEHIRVPRSPEEAVRLADEGYDKETLKKGYQKQAKAILEGVKRVEALQGKYLVRVEDRAARPVADGVGWEIALREEASLPLPILLRAKGELSESAVITLGKELTLALDELEAAGMHHGSVTAWTARACEDGTFKLTAPMGIPNLESEFCAPEVAAGASPDERSDLYAVGMILYGCLSGDSMPFTKTGEEAAALRPGGADLPEPKMGSEELKAVVRKACAWRPEDRFACAEDFRAALEALDEEKSAPSEEEVCPACGGKVAAGVRFCTHCGARMPGTEDEPAPAAAPVPADEFESFTDAVSPEPETPAAPLPARLAAPSAPAGRRSHGRISASDGSRKKLVILLIVLLGLLAAGIVTLLVLHPWNTSDQAPANTSAGTVTPEQSGGKPGDGSSSAQPGGKPGGETDTQTTEAVAPEHSQYIEVVNGGEGKPATLTLFTWKDGMWVSEMTCPAWLGQGGITATKREGDGCTPAGTFDVLFYMAAADLNSAMTFYQVQNGDVWVEDAESQYYNTIQNGTGDWKESSDMYAHLTGGKFNASIVFSYNGDCRTAGSATAGAGSAIFIEGVTETELGPTWGSVCISQQNMTWLLSLLDASKNPTVTIR